MDQIRAKSIHMNINRAESPTAPTRATAAMAARRTAPVTAETLRRLIEFPLKDRLNKALWPYCSNDPPDYLVSLYAINTRVEPLMFLHRTHTHI